MTADELKSARVLLLGCGRLGGELGLRLLAEGIAAFGLRRDCAALPAALPGASLDCGSGDMACLRGWTGDLAVMTPTPAGRGTAGYRQGYLAPVQRLLQFCPRPRSVLFVSSTRVYGDCGGAWVDEATAPRPADAEGEAILRAERLLRASSHRVVVVRPGGIYGRLPSRLVERVKAGGLSPRSAARYGNRIHSADCVGFLHHLARSMLAGERVEPCYLAVDDAPASHWEVERWLAGRLGIEPGDAPAPRGATGKRCRNASLRRSGYRLRYPDYRAGYAQVLRELASRATAP